MKNVMYIKMVIACLIILAIPSISWGQVKKVGTNLVKITHNAKNTMMLPSDTNLEGVIDKESGTYIMLFTGRDETGDYVDKIRFDETGAFVEVVSPLPVPERIYTRLEKIGVSPKISENKAPNATDKTEPLSDKIYLPIDSIKKINMVKVLPEGTSHINFKGKLFAKAIEYGGDKYDVEIYDLDSYKRLGILEECWPIHFSPDGQILAAYRYKDDTIILWDIGEMRDSGKVEKLNAVIPVDWSFEWFNPDVARERAVFSPDGKHLAVYSIEKEKINLYDTATGKTIWSGKKGYIGPFAFSPDGKLLATKLGIKKIGWDWGPCKVAILDVITGKEIKRLEYPSWELASPRDYYDLYGVFFSPDGKLITSGSSCPAVPAERGCKDLPVVMWDVATGKIIKKLPFKEAFDVVFSPDGKFLVARFSELVKAGPPMILKHSAILYDVVNEEIKTVFGNFRRGDVFGFSPDGKLIAIDDGIWSLEGFAIADSFKKDEFETTDEYTQRVKGIKFPYLTKITLGKYDADRGGFEIGVLGTKTFFPVERERAKEIAVHKERVYIQGNLISAGKDMVELVDTQIMYPPF